MTGVFEIYLKTPKKGEVYIPPPSIPTGTLVIPDMKDSERFNYRLIASVEQPGEVWAKLAEWWTKASFGDELIVRCELPV